MAKHKAYKAGKKKRKERQERRVQNIFDILSATKTRGGIIPLTASERKKQSKHVVGHFTCPFCKNRMIRVINDSGISGSHLFDYLENHYEPGTKIPCAGSAKRIK